MGENAFELNHGTACGAAAAYKPGHEADCALASDRRRLDPIASFHHSKERDHSTIGKINPFSRIAGLLQDHPLLQLAIL